MKILFFGVLLTISMCFSCQNSEQNLIPNSEEAKNNTKSAIETRRLSEAFKSYWFDGKAEITSYRLSQERYGELREGTAVTIFVTEDFLPEAQVKANSATDQTIPVLKLNQTKKFITGIYPYSVMTSTFTPLEEKTAAIKVSHSMQEWCGHVYIQLNQRDEFDIVQHSYFEGEADLETTLPLTHLESDIWNVIRINPEELPTGEFSMLPSFEYFRMSHRDLKIHSAIGALEANDTITTYRITYPDLQRSLSLSFTTEFPHTINSWEETHDNGLVTKAERIKQLKTAYWSQNGNSFRYLRDSLGL